MKTEPAIGRTRTGDQLHLCSGLTTYEDGKQTFADNAHCNQRKHLSPVGGRRQASKTQIKMRPGLFCSKCFGTDEARIIAREYLNAEIVGTDKDGGMFCDDCGKRHVGCRDHRDYILCPDCYRKTPRGA